MDGAEQGPAGSWTHSFEEDTGNEQVFRRTGAYAFPASRRPRNVLDFDSAQVIMVVPGRDDKLQRSSGPMTALGMQRYRLGDGRELEVLDAGADVLRIRVA